MPGRGLYAPPSARPAVARRVVIHLGGDRAEAVEVDEEAFLEAVETHGCRKVDVLARMVPLEEYGYVVCGGEAYLYALIERPREGVRVYLGERLAKKWGLAG